MIEDFEVAGSPFNFSIDDPYSILTVTNAVGAYGTSLSSIKADYYTASNGSAEMTSLPLDMTVFTNTPQLTFDVAYALVQSLAHDSLKVQVSADCGATWNTVYAKTTLQLSTSTGFFLAPFLPTTTQWRNEVISLAPYATANHLIVRFIFRTANGNNLYVDNININQTTGISQAAQPQFKIFPNPASDAIYLQCSNAIDKHFFVIVNDIAGRSIYKQEIKSIAANEKIAVNTTDYAHGFYTVSILFDDADKINVPVIISGK